MVDDKKKNKNKKNKNKQNKPAVDSSNGVVESVQKDSNSALVQEDHNCVSDITQVINEELKTDVDLDAQLSNGVKGVVLEEAVEILQKENVPLHDQQVAVGESCIELQNDQGTHDQKENVLEETNIGLNDITSDIQKEVSLDDTSIRLENDKSTPIQKEASLEDISIGLPHANGVDGQEKDSLVEKIKTLLDENEILSHKEASLELKLLQIEKEKDSWLHKQASLESKLLEVEKEKDYGLHKQARLEEEVSHLVEKTDSLSSKEASLEEKVKELEMEKEVWLEKENSTKETIANLNGNVSGLQMQVAALEESRNYLMHENQLLGESVSGLQFQLQNLEKRLTSAVSANVTRTANDTYLKSDPQSAVNNDLLGSASESTVEISKEFGNPVLTSKFAETTPIFSDQTDISKDILTQDEKNMAENLIEKGSAHMTNSLSQSSEMSSLPAKMAGSFEDVAFRSEGEDNRNINSVKSIVTSNSPYTNGNNGIVQIPLDKNHVSVPALQPHLDEEKTDVSLTDSPLIGAPFRMISFFARYVSGSDLVNKR